MEESKRQHDLFLAEQKRQKETVGRIEKIEINYEGPPGSEVFIMNKNLSTPYDCAKRKLILQTNEGFHPLSIFYLCRFRRKI